MSTKVKSTSMAGEKAQKDLRERASAFAVFVGKGGYSRAEREEISKGKAYLKSVFDEL